MQPRLTLDLGWSDLAAGLLASLSPRGRASLAREVERVWRSEGDGRPEPKAPEDSLACLSVRSGFDLLLTALDLPAGSEVAYTSATIGDMVRIIESHRLRAVPIDLDMATLGPRADHLERVLTPKTRALVFVHLFGARFDLEPIAAMARRRNILLIEDCAHAFVGRGYRGHRQATASLFSFGPIKTATALGGALLTVRDRTLLARMRRLQGDWPVQKRVAFARRCAKYGLLKALCWPPLYGLLFRLAERRGDPDRWIQNSVRGFSTGDLLTAIRHQPSAPLFALLGRRLRRYGSRQIAERKGVGDRAAELLGEEVARPGRRARNSTHWLFPIYSRDPAELLSRLRAGGFDATQGTAAFGVVDPGGALTGEQSPEARDALARVVFLPLARTLVDADLHRLCAIVLGLSGRK